jgi:hypothetical protein
MIANRATVYGGMLALLALAGCAAAPSAWPTATTSASLSVTPPASNSPAPPPATEAPQPVDPGPTFDQRTQDWITVARTAAPGASRFSDEALVAIGRASCKAFDSAKAELDAYTAASNAAKRAGRKWGLTTNSEQITANLVGGAAIGGLCN